MVNQITHNEVAPLSGNLACRFSRDQADGRIIRAAHSCLGRVGIIPPKVTINADDPQLRAGLPASDPFLFVAECLGYQASRCVVFEDSPSGIKAGVASGAIVIAVCTSHSRKQIEECGAHFVVENLEDVCTVCCEEMETDEGTRLMFPVEHRVK